MDPYVRNAKQKCERQYTRYYKEEIVHSRGQCTYYSVVQHHVLPIETQRTMKSLVFCKLLLFNHVNLTLLSSVNLILY